MKYLVCLLSLALDSFLGAQSLTVEKYLSKLAEPTEPGFAIGVISKG